MPTPVINPEDAKRWILAHYTSLEYRFGVLLLCLEIIWVLHRWYFACLAHHLIDTEMIIGPLHFNQHSCQKHPLRFYQVTPIYLCSVMFQLQPMPGFPSNPNKEVVEASLSEDLPNLPKSHRCIALTVAAILLFSKRSSCVYWWAGR